MAIKQYLLQDEVKKDKLEQIYKGNKYNFSSLTENYYDSYSITKEKDGCQ